MSARADTGIAVDDRLHPRLPCPRGKREINTVIYRLDGALDEPRFIVYDLRFATPDGARNNETVLIFWLPDRATAQHKAANRVGYEISLTLSTASAYTSKPPRCPTPRTRNSYREHPDRPPPPRSRTAGGDLIITWAAERSAQADDCVPRRRKR
ncbi:MULTISPECIES: hypothetical protein [unclassified Streptomyces]|uniref:hypothetical protein n=1 Tax=unclassified Streptomyces TaxID=2593676 RepID=UPI00342651F6